MKRRTFLLSVGGVAAGSGAIVSSGAFSSVEAERSVTVETTGDANGLLGIAPFGSPDAVSSNATEYVNAPDGGTVSINIDGISKNAVTNIDRLLQVTNNGTGSVVVGFNNQYAIEQGDYDTPPGGWGYAVSADKSAAVVIWASPLPSNMDKSLDEVRPNLVSTGFDGSTLADGRMDDEVDKKAERRIDTGEQLHIGAIVDTRRSTVEDNPLPDSLGQTFSLFAGTPDT